MPPSSLLRLPRRSSRSGLYASERTLSCLFILPRFTYVCAAPRRKTPIPT